MCLPGDLKADIFEKKKHKTFLKSELIAHMLIKRKQGRVNREVRKMTSCRRWLRGY